MRRHIVPWMVLALSACSAMYPPHDTSTQNKISDELKQAAEPKHKTATPLPESVSQSLLPPLKMEIPKTTAKQMEPRFDLVVSDTPINQVLMGIVSGTRYSMLVQPKSLSPNSPAVSAGMSAPPVLPAITEKISVHLKDVTVFEALDAIREMYGYEYKVDGTRIYVQPPGMQVKVFQVNYIPGMRRGVSDLQVVPGASANSNGSGSNSGSNTNSNSNSGTGNSGSNGSGGTPYSAIQSSALTTSAKADVWGEIEDTLRAVLGCQIPKNVPSRPGSNSGNASRSDVSFPGDMQPGERVRGGEGCPDGRTMTINQMSGTILVRGMPDELRTIEGLLRKMQLNIERQVIIEAKIIDVELNSDSQQGINWAGFRRGLQRVSVGADPLYIDGANTTGGGAVTTGATLGNLLGTGMVGVAGSAFSGGMGMAVQLRNFSALINFLQTQGEVHVLSSPRISTLNNQKAMLKVGTEEPFITNIAPGNTTAGTGGSASVVTPPTLVYQPFFSGISLDVTPQIDDDGNITLHVHPMVNNIAEKRKVPLATVSSVAVPFAVNTVSETDSVVKTKDGQVVVIGGLMTESAGDNRSKVPGLGDAPAVGALFRKGDQKTVKRELVILLKPTIVRSDDTVWTDDIAATQRRIENLNSRPKTKEEARQVKPE